ncbi:MAG: Chromosome partition protein Smc [Candidatus Heimdallarchaeota archaeon LC_2]|nr:MAG: Chromosome partition protein Smc [Candidatus Heimdallarchaeota archaeon LC_2]
MNSSPLYSDSTNEKDADKSTTNENFLESNEKKLTSILHEYKGLLELQATERKDLLKQVDTLTQKTANFDNLDNKIENLVALLGGIREQISALSSTVPIVLDTEIKDNKLQVPGVEKYINKPTVVASEEEVEELAKQIETEADNLEDEVVTLTQLIENKTEELRERDVFIEEMNEKLEGVSDEKERLASQLDSLNSVIGSWQGQLNLLQKLAASDPRYKVIAALKKHGSLSDIQLAFTMGTSIGQIRKYIDDLRELELVRKDNSGRYIWIGNKMAEDELNL